ncbi:DUF6431 domain-containing protein [Candidatus Albibeggiatoa sp. nov. NOAA]|uniref:DUF6431 domain-containing protein n=1 Tax=Candidatus Albibeggiatoa sp. nov. NOAA TaxID=3162724 RepID=UPI003342A7B5
MRNRIFLIKSKESSYCPVCNTELSYYDRKERYVIHDDGIRLKYAFRRLECKCQTCNLRIHTEIPDFTQPFKHYAAHVIQVELDESSDSCPAESSTINLWKRQFNNNLNRLENVLKAQWHKVLNKHYPLIADSLLTKLRTTETKWLTSVTQICLKGHHGIPTQFAFSP